jgi:tetratricopeptide (TPR) repeat protein
MGVAPSWAEGRLPRAVFALGAGLFAASVAVGLLDSLHAQGSLPPLGQDPLASAQRALAEGRLDEAVPELRTLAEIQWRQPDGYVLLGAALARQGDLPGAIQAFEQALERRGPPQLHARLASLYLRSGDSTQARRHGELALRRGGALPPALERRLGLAPARQP